MFKNQPLVSVIVPVYNLSDVITETLKSIESQTYENWECVVVDDGSTDDSLKVIEKHIDNKPNFRLFQKENGGVSSARNFGAKSAKGDLLVFLDGDDLVSANFLSALVTKFKENQDLKLAYSEVQFFEGKNEFWQLPTYSYAGLLLDSMICATFVVKREDFLASGGYDESMRRGLEDWEFLIRFLNNESKVLKVSEAKVLYRIRSHSRNNSLSANEIQQLKNHIYQKHLPKYIEHFGDYIELYKQHQSVKKKLIEITGSLGFKVLKKISLIK